MSIIKDFAKQFILDAKVRPWTDVFRGAFLWLSVVLCTFFITGTIVFLHPFVYLFDNKRHSLHVVAIGWARSIIFFNPWWKFKVSGKENLVPKDKAAVYVANHQSQADILAIFNISTRFRWLAKASLFNIPIFGWSMSAVGYVPVKRGTRKSAEQCMKRAENYLKEGIPMLFFAEGTRSKTGKIGAFKSGAFRLAKALNVPVIPITVNGCSDLLPKGSVLPRNTTVTVTIHPAIETSNLDVHSIMEKAHAVISSALPAELR